MFAGVHHNSPQSVSDVRVNVGIDPRAYADCECVARCEALRLDMAPWSAGDFELPWPKERL